MANPLTTGLFPHNTGKQPPQRERPNTPGYTDKLTPVPDPDVDGEVFAYRGTETHGVESGNIHFADVPGYEDMVPVEFEEPEIEPEPVPVRIVNESVKEVKAWAVGRSYANISGNGANRIVGQDDNRTSLRIRNIGSAQIWVAPEPNLATPTFGYPIPTGTEFALDDATLDIWALSEDAAVPTAIAVLSEYVTK